MMPETNKVDYKTIFEKEGIKAPGYLEQLQQLEIQRNKPGIKANVVVTIVSEQRRIFGEALKYRDTERWIEEQVKLSLVKELRKKMAEFAASLTTAVQCGNMETVKRLARELTEVVSVDPEAAIQPNTDTKVK